MVLQGRVSIIFAARSRGIVKNGPPPPAMCPSIGALGSLAAAKNNEVHLCTDVAAIAGQSVKERKSKLPDERLRVISFLFLSLSRSHTNSMFSAAACLYMSTEVHRRRSGNVLGGGGGARDPQSPFLRTWRGFWW